MHHPVILAIHFLLEVIALIVLGYWGWKYPGTPFNYLLAMVLPITIAAVWTIFRVPGYPGNAIVPVSGFVRLLIELGVFALTVLALYDLRYKTLSWAIAAIVIFHYLISLDGVLQMLKIQN